MDCLKVLLDDTGMQTFLEQHETSIIDGANAFHEYPQQLKDHIVENLQDFVAPTLDETYENMVKFVETAAFQYLTDIVDSIEV